MEGGERRERAGSSGRQDVLLLGVGGFGMLVMEVWFNFEPSVDMFGRARGLRVPLVTS